MGFSYTDIFAIKVIGPLHELVPETDIILTIRLDTMTLFDFFQSSFSFQGLFNRDILQ